MKNRLATLPEIYKRALAVVGKTGTPEELLDAETRRHYGAHYTDEKTF